MYNRESDLMNKFNNMIENLRNVEGPDYYSKFKTINLIGLKSALSSINNVITLRLTFSLADWICQKFDLVEETRDKLINSIQKSKPNTNGFDIELLDPDIVAEVKCNIPINSGVEYGVAQRNGLTKDIEGLLYGKTRSLIKTEGAFKFLGVYDNPEVRKATDHFVKRLPIRVKEYVIVEPNQSQILDRNHVYIIFVK